MEASKGVKQKNLHGDSCIAPENQQQTMEYLMPISFWQQINKLTIICVANASKVRVEIIRSML